MTPLQFISEQVAAAFCARRVFSGVLHLLSQRVLHSYLLITSRQEALVVTSGGALEPASQGGFLSSEMWPGLSRPGLSRSVLSASNNMVCVAVSARGVVKGGALFADHFALTVVTSLG
jgi:hypothetical protein